MEKRQSTRLPTRSRLPTASSSLAASTSSTTATTKRTASTAQLGGEIEHALTRRKAKVDEFSANMTKTALERRALEAEQAKRNVEADLVKVKHERDKVERDRRWFAEREKEIMEEREAERTAFEDEKKEMAAETKELRLALDNLRRQFDTLSDSYDVLQRAATKANSVCESAQTQLGAVQEENERNHAEASKYRKLAQEREEELESLRNNSRSGASLRPVDEAGPSSKEWETLRSQLVQQTDEIRHLSDNNAKMKAELLVLKERNTNIEVLREEKRVLERRVRDADFMREQLGQLEAQIDALRQEKEKSVAQSQRSEEVPIAIRQELATLHMEHANLLGQHRSLTDVLKRREEELQNMQAELSSLQTQVISSKAQLQAAETTSLRHEKKAKTAQQEVELLNSLLENFTSKEEEEEEEPENADMTVRTGMRIAALEQLVEDLKQANEALISEMDEMGGDAAAAISGAGRGSISALKDALANERNLKTTALQDLDNARREIQELADKIETLEDDLFRLKGDIGTGRHIPPTTRVLEFANNPAAKWFGRRDEDLEKLRKENEALRSMVAESPSSPVQNATTGGLVPRETLDVLMEEKAVLEKEIKDKEKRLLRLREIFTLKAEEFKTTVTSLLGWKFRFQQNGAVQLTSVYDPNALIVFSQTTKPKRGVGPNPLEGEDIKVQLIAETAPPEVMELYRTWVAGYRCVPGFLGSLTVQLYEASPEGAARLRGEA